MNYFINNFGEKNKPEPLPAKQKFCKGKKENCVEEKAYEWDTINS